jgi:transcription termination/antitermination protein NusG
VTQDLAQRGFEALLPAHRVRKQWSDRIRVTEEAVFPGYLFCRFALSERFQVLASPSVIHVVGIRNTPIPITAVEIDAVQKIVASQIVLMPWPYLQAGELVRIDAGPLAGVQGVIIRSDTTNPRIVVSVTLMQRAVAAEIDREWLGKA